ncbi:MAG: ArsA family ATPase [Candidatus Zipacnadales bacterium]
MRIILYTGKGGVGKTCVSAAAALAASRCGQRTVILSSDRAHSLSDCFGRPLGPKPVKIAPNLHALEVDAFTEIAEHWGELCDYVRSLISSQGVNSLLAEELAIIPGLEEGCVLLRLKDLWDKAEYETLIVDCAPTGSTLRLLSFPEACNWFMRRVFPIHRAAMRLLRPTAGPFLSIPLPSEEYYEAVKRLYERLASITALLTDPRCAAVRLVTIPERMAVEETRRAYAEFSLYGLCVEQVIANRVLPEVVTDPYLEPMKVVQRQWLERIKQDFAPLEVATAPQFAGELVGLDALGELADVLFRRRDPAQPLRLQPPVRLEESDGRVRMLLDLRFAESSAVELMQRGEELVLELGSSRRNLLLPQALARLTAVGATLKDGQLEIEFETRDRRRMSDD